MLTVTFPGGVERILAEDGLTQWDYGQELRICGLDIRGDTEIHFALSGDAESIIRIGRYVDGNLTTNIPDVLLRDGRDIQAYVFLADIEEGKTIRTVIIDVQRRAEPENVEILENESVLGYLINSKADNLRLCEGTLQLMSNGNPIGDELRLSDFNGREVELKNNGAAICWRYTDSNDWTVLVELEKIRGPAGETPEFEIRKGHLFAIYNKEEGQCRTYCF